MRIDVKKVNGHEYLQYIDVYGHIFHIGSANNFENWKIACWLYGFGLDNLKLDFHKKIKAEIQRRFPEEESDFSSFVNEGMSGSIGGFDEVNRERLNKIFDAKAIENDKIRDLVRETFPDLKGKENLKRTVDGARKYQKQTQN